jgi:hypothetical protein
MWQISSGRKPSCSNDYDASLALAIQRGMREENIDGTTISYR